MLARNCKYEGVQEQTARALANLAVGQAVREAVRQEEGVFEALIQLTRSPHEGVRQEAAHALSNFSFNDRNQEAIAAAGGVQALVALAQSCSNASPRLQVRAAGALLGLSVSETNSIAIGREGGVAPLIALARSEAEDVHEAAAGALCNLALNPGNALLIVEELHLMISVHHQCQQWHGLMRHWLWPTCLMGEWTNSLQSAPCQKVFLRVWAWMETEGWL
jgi:hypothetical protein